VFAVLTRIDGEWDVPRPINLSAKAAVEICDEKGIVELYFSDDGGLLAFCGLALKSELDAVRKSPNFPMKIVESRSVVVESDLNVKTVVDTLLTVLPSWVAPPSSDMRLNPTATRVI
jgi:hypothetical protein